jgi:nucleoside-diphosphate-sugar epimerase
MEPGEDESARRDHAVGGWTMSTSGPPVGADGQTPALPRRVFVTGARGFIGRALMRRYRDLGAAVCGVDVEADPEWDVVAGDIGESGAWQDHARDCDLVINTAAVVSNTAPRELYWQISVNGVRKVIDAAVAGGASRFVQISSCAAFGVNAPAGVDERWPIPVATGRHYVDAKAAGEHPALAAHASGEIACTIIRPSDVYGPGSRPWILIPLEMIRKGLFILPAHGKSIFSPVHIDDLVDGVVLAAGLESGAGQIITITGGKGLPCEEFFSYHWRWAGKSGSPRSYSTATAVRIAETARIVSRLLGKKTEAGRDTMLMLAKNKDWSIDKARRLLGYEPKVTVEEGMRRTESWLREQGIVQ